MKVVLAEKPSVARDIAQVLGAGGKREGYFEGAGYQVTWAYGHLAELQEPEDYHPSWKKWTLTDLPIVPEQFELKLSGDRRARAQFAVVKKLLQRAGEIVCATDAGREGELIFRYILRLAGCEHREFQRLWLSSLTPVAIRQAMNRLRDGSEFDNLYAAARCRSEADWIVGLNTTRCLTVQHREQGVLWSAGRVQTPVLALIVGRDDEIRTFRPEPFWELLTRYRKVLFKYAGDRFTKEDDAQQMLARTQGYELVITRVQRKQETNLPPQLYDLTELQRDMNRRYGLSAEATLQAAQTLYEKKLVTYPRTDSRYLSDDLKRAIPDTLEKLAAIKPEEISRLNLASLPFNGRIVNSKKVTDHHAIIPTGGLPGELRPAERKVFDAVLTRLIAVFYPPCLKEVTTIDAVSNDVKFRAVGVRVTDPGWTVLYPRKEKERDDADAPQSLPEFREQERGPHQPYVKRGETTPPKPYNENTLLGAMETAGKLVDDEQLKEALKERGLGTPATRAAIIETLLRREYIVRTGKNLAATDLGRYLAAIIHDPRLKSAELTGEWEAQLKQIEAGRLEADAFMHAVAQYAGEIVQGVQHREIDLNQLGPCPRCGKPVIEGKRDFGCSGWRNGCKFVLRREYKGHTLSLEEIRELLQQGALLAPIELPETGPAVLALTVAGGVVDIPPPQPQERKKGRGARSKFAARKGAVKKDGSEKTPAAEPSLGRCPLCSASVREQKKSYSCEKWNDGCPFVIWKMIAGKKIGKQIAKKLLTKGETEKLKGFKSKAGAAFEAKLTLVDGKPQLEFER